ncbi:MAG: peptidoglycan DD-metalloendopeptidase family protein, partial [Actinomycetota bacterium]|nr:peptidoglycan DD-metalloendopeptidase family protein [Actinomycetota bacterium]
PYVAPVDGAVVRHFDRPHARWGRGHRGVDLAATDGEAVATAGDGTVAFAGTVAGRTWVSVDHPDGIRTAYGPLTTVEVVPGQRVDQGQRVGTVAPGHDPRRVVVHWSARRGGRYLDPLTLLDAGSWRPALVGPGATVVTDLPDVPSYAPWPGRARGLAGRLGLVAGSPVAEHAGWVLPPNPNHVIGVAGLGSRSGGKTKKPLDLTHLGYDPQDVTYFSYAGRRPGAPADGSGDQLSYGPQHTFLGVERAARRLRDQLRAHARANPGQAVDLVGHSMGGIVVLHYLLTLHDPANPTLPPVAHAVTLASPVQGADLATAVRLAATDAMLRSVIDGVAPLVGLPRHDDQALRDLAVASPLVRELASAWEQALRDRWGGPLAAGTQVLTVGGSRDVTVPEHRSELPRAPHVVLPGDHQRMRETEASRLVIRAFLADRPVPGQPGGLGHWLSYPVGWGEQLTGFALATIPGPPFPGMVAGPLGSS